jgi:hypothetical protein
MKKKKLKKWKWYKVPGKKVMICYVGDRSFGYNFAGEWTNSFNMDYTVTNFQDWVKVDEKEIRQRLFEMMKKANKMDKILSLLEHE